MGRTRPEVYDALALSRRRPQATPAEIAGHAPMILEALGNWDSGAVLEGEAIEQVTAIVSLLSAADPAVLESTLRRWSPTERDGIGRGALNTAIFTSPQLPFGVEYAALAAIAAAVADLEAAAWRFPELFPAGYAQSWDAPAVIRLLGGAGVEIDRDPAPARRLDARILLLECMQRVFSRPARPDMATVIGGHSTSRLGRDLRDPLRALVEALLRDARGLLDPPADDEAVARFVRLWSVLRHDWLDVLGDGAAAIAALCPSPRAAARVSALLDDETATVRDNPRVQALRFELARRAGAPEAMRALLPKRPAFPSIEAVARCFVACGRAPEAITWLEQLPTGGLRDDLLAELLAASGRSADALALAVITPDNVEVLAKQHGVVIDELVRLGLERSDEPEPWLAYLVARGDWTAVAALAAKGVHPDALLAALPSAPAELARTLATAVLDGVLSGATTWLDEARAELTARAAFDACLARTVGAKARASFLAKTRKRVDKAIGRADFVRTLAFVVDDALREVEDA